MGDEYTPTTDEIRRDWVQLSADAYSLVTDDADEVAVAEFDRWLEAHDREVAEKAWDEGQKSGMRYTDRMRAAYEIGRPELPGPPSINPYREGATL